MATTALPDADTPFGERVRRRLREETTIWLTTVGADGTPQPNPVWFLWEPGEGDDAGHLMVYNRADAHRLRHIARNPAVALHFDGNGKGGDIVVLRGHAAVIADHPAAHESADYVAKYGPAMTRVSGSEADFGAAYPVALRIPVEGIRGF
jgi:PPOX class probable F420-dependent enzyme